MSIRSLSEIAVQRDTIAPRKVTKKQDHERPQAVPQSWADVIIAAIPTEVLAVYTAVVGVIVSTIAVGGDRHLLLRWVLYSVGIASVVIWLASNYFRESGKARRKRKFPFLETFTAAVAFAAWGLVMPGAPLSEELGRDNQIIWTAIITGAAILLLGMLGTPLKEKVKDRS